MVAPHDAHAYNLYCLLLTSVTERTNGMRHKPLSLLLALATTLSTGGFSFMSFAPVANAAEDSGLRVLGSPDTVREATITMSREEFEQAVKDDQAKLDTMGGQQPTVSGSNLVGAPNISETTIAILPPYGASSNSWAGTTVEKSDDSGRRYVTWLDKRDQSVGGLGSVYFSRSVDNGVTWSAPARVDAASGPANAYLGLNMVADQNGNVVIFWNDTRNTGTGGFVSQLFVSRSTDAGQTWSTPGFFDASRIPLFLPTTTGTLDSDGNLNMFWPDVRNGFIQTWGIHSSDKGASWSADQRIDDSPVMTAEIGPVAVLGKNSEVLLGWFSARAGGSGEDFIGARSTDGGATFGADFMFNTNAAGTLNLTGYNLCSDGNGHVLATFRTDVPAVSDNGTLHFRTSSDFGATWSASDAVLATDVDNDRPLASACAFGSTYMVAMWQDANRGIFVASSTDGGANWTLKRINLDVPYPGGSLLEAQEMVVDVDANGRIVAAWTDDRNGGGANDVWVNYSVDAGQNWSTSNIKATNGTSGDSDVILTDGALSVFATSGGTDSNTRLVFNMSFFDPRAGAEGLYSTTATFAGSESGMTRVAGATRYTTSVEIAKSQFPTAGTVSTAVFATGENFPDGLSATGLAAMVNGPVYLVKKNSLPSEVAADFLRIYDKKSDAKVDAYFVGGTAAISAAVEASVKALDPSITTKRLAGSNRKGTAIEVNEEQDALRGHGPKMLVLARSNDFADALTGGSVAGNTGIQNDFGGVLLTEPGSLDNGVKAYLTSVGSTLDTVHIVGGTSAISGGVATAVDAVAKNVVRHAGGNRYATAAQVAEDFYKGALAPQTFGLASGTNFADALPGGLWTALHLSPLLLTTPTTLSTDTADYLRDNADTINSGVAFGGPAALSQTVLDAAALLY